MAVTLGVVLSGCAAGLLVIWGLRMIREETAKKASCQAATGSPIRGAAESKRRHREPGNLTQRAEKAGSHGGSYGDAPAGP